MANANRPYVTVRGRVERLTLRKNRLALRSAVRVSAASSIALDAATPNKKYKVTGEGRLLAKKDIPDAGVKAGDEGGFVARARRSLSHRSTCWVDYKSTILEKGRVQGRAQVVRSTIKGKALVKGKSVVTDSLIADRAVVRKGARVSNSEVTGKSMVTKGAVVVNTDVGEYAYIKGATVRSSKVGGQVVGGEVQFTTIEPKTRLRLKKGATAKNVHLVQRTPVTISVPVKDIMIDRRGAVTALPSLEGVARAAEKAAKKAAKAKAKRVKAKAKRAKAKVKAKAKRAKAAKAEAKAKKAKAAKAEANVLRSVSTDLRGTALRVFRGKEIALWFQSRPEDAHALAVLEERYRADGEKLLIEWLVDMAVAVPSPAYGEEMIEELEATLVRRAVQIAASQSALGGATTGLMTERASRTSRQVKGVLGSEEVTKIFVEADQEERRSRGPKGRPTPKRPKSRR